MSESLNSFKKFKAEHGAVSAWLAAVLVLPPLGVCLITGLVVGFVAALPGLTLALIATSIRELLLCLTDDD